VSTATIRPAYSSWPAVNRALCDVVATLTDEQLALQPSPERWPLWATIGHAACQRVFWLCVFAGEPGADTTPFTNSGYSCPGDEDLEHVLNAEQLVEALDSTFRIIEGCLDRWTIGMLDEVIRHREGGESREHSRGWVIQRVFIHDVYHCAELNETFGRAGMPQIDLWD
jgi:uncharacterized damage-inducible protein DinB